MPRGVTKAKRNQHRAIDPIPYHRLAFSPFCSGIAITLEPDGEPGQILPLGRTLSLSVGPTLDLHPFGFRTFAGFQHAE